MEVGNEPNTDFLEKFQLNQFTRTVTNQKTSFATLDESCLKFWSLRRDKWGIYFQLQFRSAVQHGNITRNFCIESDSQVLRDA